MNRPKPLMSIAKAICLPAVILCGFAYMAAAQSALSDNELRSQIVGNAFLLNDGRIVQYASNGDYTSVNGRGQTGRGRWSIADHQICVDYVGSNTTRRCFEFSRGQDGLRVTDRDQTDQRAVPTSLSLASIGSPLTFSACEHNIAYSLTPPAADVPANYRAFSGVWVGKWESGLCGALFVQQILPDGTARLVVGWGSHVYRKPGDMGLLGKIAGNVLTAHGRDYSYNFTMTDPTSLDAVFSSAGATQGRLTKAK